METAQTCLLCKTFVIHYRRHIVCIKLALSVSVLKVSYFATQTWASLWIAQELCAKSTQSAIQKLTLTDTKAARGWKTYTSVTGNPELEIFQTGKQKKPCKTCQNIYDNLLLFFSFFIGSKFRHAKYAQIVQENRSAFDKPSSQSNKHSNTTKATHIEEGPLALMSAPAWTNTGIQSTCLFLAARCNTGRPLLLSQLGLAPWNKNQGREQQWRCVCSVHSNKPKNTHTQNEEKVFKNI